MIKQVHYSKRGLFCAALRQELLAEELHKAGAFHGAPAVMHCMLGAKSVHLESAGVLPGPDRPRDRCSEMDVESSCSMSYTTFSGGIQDGNGHRFEDIVDMKISGGCCL